jgi:hypothetical protein
MTISAGVGRADITPEIGVTLSGFIAREGKPSTSVDDPLMVRVLVLQGDQAPLWLVNYDLLGLPRAICEAIQVELAATLGEAFQPERCVLTATHTHSGPPVSPLEGEEGVAQKYLDFICRQTAVAAGMALAGLRPANLNARIARVSGLTYNRRAVLEDGRVAMAEHPDAPVVSRGPMDDEATVLLFSSQKGEHIAGILHYACHGVALQTQAISADIPGELARRFEKQTGAPFLFLQGGSGDINPTCVVSDRATMLRWCDEFMARFHQAAKERVIPPVWDLESSSLDLPLDIEPLPSRETILQHIHGYERIAQGDVVSADIQPTVGLMRSFMNVRPGDNLEPGKVAFVAKALANARRRSLAALDAGPLPGGVGASPLPPCPLRISLWQLGEVALAFTAAELFAVTGLRLRALGAGRILLPVTHAAPITGYIPDRESIAKGGYEVNDAWQFYRQPGPFTADAEERIVHAFQNLLGR